MPNQFEEKLAEPGSEARDMGQSQSPGSEPDKIREIALENSKNTESLFAATSKALG